jgi:hypothetical protein
MSAHRAGKQTSQPDPWTPKALYADSKLLQLPHRHGVIAP